ncbi:MAG: hypothetical protein ACI9TA_003087, partial [Reinekea sp.]
WHSARENHATFIILQLLRYIRAIGLVSSVK